MLMMTIMAASAFVCVALYIVGCVGFIDALDDPDEVEAAGIIQLPEVSESPIISNVEFWASWMEQGRAARKLVLHYGEDTQ